MKELSARTLLLAGLLATQITAAQEEASPKGLPLQATNYIADDDGGVVQIVPVELGASGPAKANTARPMKSIRQVSVFLGRAWAQPSMRIREASLWDLAGYASLTPLLTQNASILAASASVEEFVDLKGPVNDLTIQTKLVEMLESRTLPDPDASAVFVVFLAPGVKLTVGSHTAGVDFAAYHNLIHVKEGELRYVVVPFDQNVNHHATAASLAIVDTLLNPASY